MKKRMVMIIMMTNGEEEEVCDEVVEGVGDDGAVFSPIFCTFVRLSF